MKKELKIANGQSLFVDQKTHARTLAIPFELPDDSHCVLMITRLKNENWFPEKIISSITIEYYEDTTPTKDNPNKARASTSRSAEHIK